MMDADAPSSSDEPRRAARPTARSRLGMVALFYAYRALGALVIAAPVAAVATDLVGAYPRGDAVLFDAGGVMLVEAARLSRQLLVPLAVSGGSVALLVAVLGLLPLAALIAALGREGRLSARFLAGRAASSFSTLVLLGGAALLAQAVLAALIVLLGQKSIELARLGVRAADIARVGVFLVALTAVLVIGVVHDLARAAAVDEDRRFYLACVRALRVAMQGWLRIVWAYAWRGALALVGILVAVGLAHRLGVETGARLALGAVGHQVAIALAVFLRASWLAAAVGLLGQELPLTAPPADVPAPGRAEPSPKQLEAEEAVIAPGETTNEQEMRSDRLR